MLDVRSPGAGCKAAIYADAGVNDCWIVNLADRVLELHREPHEGRYRSVTARDAGVEIALLEFPDVVISVGESERRSKRSR